ncbi:hypothetical protein VitviT2T_030097 [Vitis vinifera]|uniref:Protein root UVB sensitive/RUS domain-containing protein n=1 Tax=Vitis vinifera TaxID=29760 RepID=A0ABY9DYF8_VITVI|nr:hypothetical protein VitviT2T_030097 [Vitis vinifera]
MARFSVVIRPSALLLGTSFIPQKVSGNYKNYVKRKFLHRVFRSAFQVLATQAMFQAMEAEHSRFISSAAALNWVLKNGLGHLL